MFEISYLVFVCVLGIAVGFLLRARATQLAEVMRDMFGSMWAPLQQAREQQMVNVFRRLGRTFVGVFLIGLVLLVMAECQPAHAEEPRVLAGDEWALSRFSRLVESTRAVPGFVALEKISLEFPISEADRRSLGNTIDRVHSELGLSVGQITLDSKCTAEGRYCVSEYLTLHDKSPVLWRLVTYRAKESWSILQVLITADDLPTLLEPYLGK